MRNLFRRLLRFLFEQDETYYDTGRSWADSKPEPVYPEPETDPVAYTRAHTTSPAVLALMDEVERGRQQRERRNHDT
jgi:hypothetical protein